MPSPPSAKELVEKNLSYIGESRLQKMSEEFLGEILEEYVKVERHVAEGEEPSPARVSKTELIGELLRRKKKAADHKPKPSPLSKQDSEEAPAAEPVESPESPEPAAAEAPGAHSLPDGEKTKLVPSGTDGIALEVTVSKEGESTRIFKERHELRVCSFNSLKLRTGKVGLEDQWLMLIATLSTFDVVLVQEVPAEGQIKDVEKTRANLLKKAFEHHSADDWTIVLSEPCGPGNLEVHVALVRHPIEVVSSCTNRTACGVPLDHAPLTIKIKDTRFKSEGDQTWVLSSVHFPPKTRARDRDVQIKAFLKDYERQAAFRLDTPLTEKGAKDARTPTVHHLVCGDFNCFPGIGFGLETHGFAPPMLGEHVSTSSGGQAYDNFVISKFAANKFSVDSDVLELAMPFVKGQDGVSDHSPIVLKVRDTTSTKNKRSSAPKQPETIPEEEHVNAAKTTADGVASNAVKAALEEVDGVVV
jgi:endonuclease/exonuclease/phosphatase family metal-dependent hydrolase